MTDPSIYDDHVYSSPRIRELIEKQRQAAQHILSGRIETWDKYQAAIGRYLAFCEAIEILTVNTQHREQNDA